MSWALLGFTVDFTPLGLHLCHYPGGTCTLLLVPPRCCLVFYFRESQSTWVTPSLLLHGWEGWAERTVSLSLC